MLAPLTPRQKEILEFIDMYYELHNLSPSLEEIRKHFNLSAVSTVHEHVDKLKKKGYLQKEMNQARGIKTIHQQDFTDDSATEISILGTITAGDPIEPVEVPEPLVVSSDFIAEGKEYFALKVSGESMIEEGILDGDLVIVKSQTTANNGDTVVAVIKDDEDEAATLKKFYKERDIFRLQPANEKLKPIYAKKVEVRGKVVGLIRQY
jgi:repressor LexA